MSDDWVDPRLIMPPESGQRLPSLSRAIPMLANYLGLRADPLRMRQATVVTSAQQADATVEVQYADEPSTKYAQALSGIRPAAGDTVWLTEQPPDEPLLIGIQGDQQWDKFAWDPVGVMAGTWPGGNPRPMIWVRYGAFNTNADGDTFILFNADFTPGGILFAVAAHTDIYDVNAPCRMLSGNLVARVLLTGSGPLVNGTVALCALVVGWVE
jgi:hypothetical protein